MKYVDGFVLVVPKKSFGKYKEMASNAGKIWKKFGALEYFECMGDDLNPGMEGMKSLGFSKLTKLKKNENIWFSFIIYKSKSHRNSVNKKVMDYYKKKYPNMPMDMPFDMKRFSYGGFKAVVER